MASRASTLLDLPTGIAVWPILCVASMKCPALGGISRERSG